MATGLRQRESLGPKWEDLDLERGDLRVKRQIARINGEVVEAPLKTKNAYRTLLLTKDTVDVLTQQKNWVFPGPAGGPMSLNSVLRMLRRGLKRAGVSQVRFHDLKHSCVTIMLYLGYTPKDIQTWLRHSGYNFTVDTYCHSGVEVHEQMAERFSEELKSLISGRARKITPLKRLSFKGLLVVRGGLGPAADRLRDSAKSLLWHQADEELRR